MCRQAPGVISSSRPLVLMDQSAEADNPRLSGTEGPWTSPRQHAANGKGQHKARVPPLESVHQHHEGAFGP